MNEKRIHPSDQAEAILDEILSSENRHGNGAVLDREKLHHSIAPLQDQVGLAAARRALNIPDETVFPGGFSLDTDLHPDQRGDVLKNLRDGLNDFKKETGVTAKMMPGGFEDLHDAANFLRHYGIVTITLQAEETLGRIQRLLRTGIGAQSLRN